MQTLYRDTMKEAEQEAAALRNLGFMVEYRECWTGGVVVTYWPMWLAVN